jgi:phosphonate transport system permease protein
MTIERLEDLNQPRPWWHHVFKHVGFVLMLVVLGVTFRVTHIDPLMFWNNRDKGVEHFFGRNLSDEEIATAHEEAERFASEHFHEQASGIVRQQYEERDRPFDSMRAYREIQTEADRLMTTISPAERQVLVDEKYAEIIDKKRGGYLWPDFAARPLSQALDKLAETVAMALWGTLFAFFLAVPFSVLAARNTLAIIASGESIWARLLRGFSTFVVRRFFDFCRGFNEIVLGLIFVAIVGLGPFAGVLALAVHTFGVLGKVFSDTIEAIDPQQIEGVTATGAPSPHVVAYAVVPQILPTIISYSLLRFESNVRSATVLGFVGAGGIGFLIQDWFQGYLHRRLFMAMLLVIVCVSIIDLMTNKLRRRFI